MFWLRAGVVCSVAACAIPLGVTRAAAANADNVTCSGGMTFSGTATNVNVPAGQLCILSGATVTHDVTAGTDSGLAVENTSIGHDLIGTKIGEIITGWGGGNPGPVTIGHDLMITGADPDTSSSNDNGFDICDTTVRGDLRVVRTAPNYEIYIGDYGTSDYDFCVNAVTNADSVRGDLSVIYNTAGFIDVGNNTVDGNLVVSWDTATTATGDLGTIDVSDNTVYEKASCQDDSPGLSRDGPEDGPNHVTHSDTCEPAATT